jgi:putative oxidoreductase
MKITVQYWASFFSVAFLAIVFLQSGLDKLFNYKKELGWVMQKFVRSPLHDYAPLLFFVLTISEVITGGCCFAGVLQLFFSGDNTFAIIGSWAACLTMLMLLFGQRIRKDYTGAAVLVPYFIVCLLAMHFLTSI